MAAPSDEDAPPPSDGDRTVVVTDGAGRGTPRDDGIVVGSVLNDNYRIDRRIGEGGMGEVYEGVHLFTGNRVAVKMIHPQQTRDDTVVSLFRREARILFGLSNDAIVRYLDSFRHGPTGRYCLVTEMIEGPTLGEYVGERGPLEPEAARQVMVRLARALHEAHGRGVVHRDLSPDNVMLRGGALERATLIDFGIASAEELGEGKLAGRFAGKFRYVAPEQLGLHDGAVGPWTDVYGLALLMAAVLRGTPLPMGRTEDAARDARARIPDLDGVPDPFPSVLAAMLAPAPADRPADMAAVLRRLDDAARGDAVGGVILARPPGQGSPRSEEDGDLSGLGAAPLGQRAPEPDPPAPASQAPGGGVPVWLVAASLVMGGGGLGWWWFQNDSAAPAEETAAIGPAEVPRSPPLPPPDLDSLDGRLASIAADAPCRLAHRVASGPMAGTVLRAATDRGSLPDLSGIDTSDLRGGMDTVDVIVTDAQCMALNLVTGLQGRGATDPVVSLDVAEVRPAEGVLGRVADLRGRTTWLALVAATGEVIDLSERLRAQPDGSALFDFALSEDGTRPGPQIVLAVASPDPLLSLAAAEGSADAAALLPRVLEEAAAAGAGVGMAVVTLRR
ncbi:serine/threonine-protein kinase [Jannaschia sp. LMIT008]|uniref:serine/threonine-protein kinase n=1 Tax=Jannaschia maritima TaxID=3032585 RepID=UPI002811CCF6|nr:serine/threonine-protein kinase [Jannaschia sp. LMIT008]